MKKISFVKRLQEAFFLVDSRCFHRPAKTDNSRNGGGKQLSLPLKVLICLSSLPIPAQFFQTSFHLNHLVQGREKIIHSTPYDFVEIYHMKSDFFPHNLKGAASKWKFCSVKGKNQKETNNNLSLLWLTLSDFFYSLIY